MTTRQEDPKKAPLDLFQASIMNTTFSIAIEKTGFEWKEAILSFLKYMENEFSRFRKGNELWRFNEAGQNTALRVSPILYDLLKKAEEYRLKTKGRFSPYLLTPLEKHGYTRSFPFQTADGDETTIQYKIESHPLLFLEDNRIIKKTSQKIDVGGIAKGYTVESIARWLQTHTHSRFGIVDGGGDIAVWSNGEKTWKIGIMDPFHEEKEIGSFSIQNGGIATSNIVYRSWMQGSTKKHHILDGRTGMPVSSDIVQATVITSHCLDAEVGAKICFMADGMPADAVLSMVCKTFRYVLVKTNGKIETGGIG